MGIGGFAYNFWEYWPAQPWGSCAIPPAILEKPLSFVFLMICWGEKGKEALRDLLAGSWGYWRPLRRPW